MSHSDLGSLLEDRARETGGLPFLMMDGARLSFAQFNESVNRVAHGLVGAGVGPGHCVVIMLGNSLEFLLVSFALKKIGAVEVPINTEFRGAGLAHTVNMTQAKILVTEDRFVGHLAAIRDDLKYLRSVALVGNVDAARSALPTVSVDPFEQLLGDRADNPGRKVHDTELATVLFTSGTTGRSKGCMLSHRYAVRTGQMVIDGAGLLPSDCLYCPFPLYHVDAAFMTVVPALLLGGRAAIGAKFSVSGFWDEVRSFDATVFDFMGATLAMLWKRDAAPDDADNPVRLAWGVPMPAWRREFERRFDLRLVHAYGLTDGGMPCWEDLDANEPTGSCGKAYPPYEVRIFDDRDDPLPPGEVGEIVIRSTESDVMMKGYWGEPERTLEAFRNLWLHTGDLGWVDSDGHLFFAGRQKDAIRRRGENISAFEIEEVLLEHPSIEEAVAVGVPSELTEEDVKVVIVLKSGHQLSGSDVREYCGPRMARFMIPEYVEFVDSIPKTPTGKPEKYRLIGTEHADRAR